MNRGLIKLILALIALIFLGWFFLGSSANDRVISDIPEKADRSAAVKIIAFGDSLTAGYGLTESESYPAQLEDSLLELGYDAEVINSGVSGETTRGNLERAEFISSQAADVVIIGIGGNDALRALPLSDTKENITSTINTLKSTAEPPVILLLKMQAPLNAGLGYKRDFDDMYEEIAAEQGLILIPFLTAELFLDPANKLSDGIHYNAFGYGQAVERYILPELTKVLDRLLGK